MLENLARVSGPSVERELKGETLPSTKPTAEIQNAVQAEEVQEPYLLLARTEKEQLGEDTAHNSAKKSVLAEAIRKTYTRTLHGTLNSHEKAKPISPNVRAQPIEVPMSRPDQSNSPVKTYMDMSGQSPDRKKWYRPTSPRAPSIKVV